MSTPHDGPRPLSEVRVVAFRLEAMGLKLKEAYWTEIPELKRERWFNFILIDDYDLHYWLETHR